MKQINNVFVWNLLKQELMYSDDVSNMFCVDFLNNQAPEKYNLNYEPSYFYQLIDNSILIVDDINQPSSIYAGNKLHPFDMNDIGSLVIKQHDPRYLVLYKGKMEEKIYRVFDWVQNKVKIEGKRPFTIVKDKAFSIIDEVLHCYSLNGELNWRYDPGNKQKEIKKLIGIYDDELWIQLNDESFLVLDVVTGNELFAMNLEEIFGIPKLGIGDLHLDETSGKIRILAYWYYIEIDLATHLAEIKKKHDEVWSIGRGRFYDGDVRVYFTSAYPMLGKTIGNITAGIFNTETLEIEWYYTLPREDKYHSFENEPQANEKYFGVKDSNKTLYLFER